MNQHEPRHGGLAVSLAVVLAATLAGTAPQVAAQEGDVVAQLRLAPRLAIPVAGGAHSVVAEDISGDGHLDLLVATAKANEVALLLGKTDGSFEPPRRFAVGTMPKYAVTADFNGDGVRDLVVAEQDNNSIGILLGSGGGSFRERVGYDSCHGVHEVVVADFNADGKDDVAAACHGPENFLSVFPGVGDGTLGPRQDLHAGREPASLAAADMDGDGRPDLVIANRASDTVSILLSLPDGSFRQATNVATGHAPHAVRVADLDQDGHPDIITANDEGTSVSVLWGMEDGFEAHTDLPARSQPKSIAAADINGDGLRDLLVTNTTYPVCCTAAGSTLGVYLNGGDRNFRGPQEFFVGGNPFSLWIGDLDGDGHADVTTANYIDLPGWLHRYPILATVLDAGTGSRSARLVRLAAIAVLGLAIAAATWQRRRFAGIAAGLAVVTALGLLLLWVRSLKDLSHVSILMGY